MGRQELKGYLARTLDTRINYVRVLYDKATGLSRCAGTVVIDNEEVARSLLRRGSLNIDGRTVSVRLDSK